jgi:hypothetical protein
LQLLNNAELADFDHDIGCVLAAFKHNVAFLVVAVVLFSSAAVTK